VHNRGTLSGNDRIMEDVGRDTHWTDPMSPMKGLQYNPYHV
jgi:hypothetical protein